MGYAPTNLRKVVFHTAPKQVYVQWMCCSATHCNILQQTATHYDTLQHAAIDCSSLQHTATRKLVDRDYVSLVTETCTHATQETCAQEKRRHTATRKFVDRDYVSLSTRCNTLQLSVARCNTLQHAANQGTTLHSAGTLYNTLKHSATHCNNTLQ